MRTSGDILTEILARGNISTTSSYITDDILRDYTNRAYRWASAYKKWPFTEGRSTTTFASLATNETGDLETSYPEGWKPDSIRLLTIGGKRIQKIGYEDFRIFREERESADDRIFTDFGLLYMVNPNIDASGSVVAYGQFTPAALDLTDSTSSSGTTVFSDREEDAHEAIVYKAIAFVRTKERKGANEIQYWNDLAVQTLDLIWKRHQDEQYGYLTKDRSLWKRLDILSGVENEEFLKRDQF